MRIVTSVTVTLICEKMDDIHISTRQDGKHREGRSGVCECIVSGWYSMCGMWVWCVSVHVCGMLGSVSV